MSRFILILSSFTTNPNFSMLHRHVNVMEYIENNIAVLVTVYGINQEGRHYKKDPMNIII